MQFSEKIIFEGECRPLLTFPILIEHHRIVARTPDDAMRSDSECFSTGCHRGYIGTWAIQNDCFFLVGLKGKRKLVGDDFLFADWYSGTLVVAKGPQLPMGLRFAPRFAIEIRIGIERGQVCSIEVSQ
jgi:hypothetical protein